MARNVTVRLHCLVLSGTKFSRHEIIFFIELLNLQLHLKRGLVLIMLLTVVQTFKHRPRNNICINIYTHTHLTVFVRDSGLSGWAGTRKVKPVWILLKQETVSGSGISWDICKSAPRSRQITTPAPHPTTQFFTVRMPFLPSNQQCQSTEGINTYTVSKMSFAPHLTGVSALLWEATNRKSCYVTGRFQLSAVGSVDLVTIFSYGFVVIVLVIVN